MYIRKQHTYTTDNNKYSKKDANGSKLREYNFMKKKKYCKNEKKINLLFITENIHKDIFSMLKNYGCTNKNTVSKQFRTINL